MDTTLVNFAARVEGPKYDKPPRCQVRGHPAGFENQDTAATIEKSASPLQGSLAKWGIPMNRNVLYALVGALIVATAVLGYKVYQDNKEPQGLQINLGPGGVKIQNK